MMGFEVVRAVNVNNGWSGSFGWVHELLELHCV